MRQKNPGTGKVVPGLTAATEGHLMGDDVEILAVNSYIPLTACGPGFYQRIGALMAPTHVVEFSGASASYSDQVVCRRPRKWGKMRDMI